MLPGGSLPHGRWGWLGGPPRFLQEPGAGLSSYFPSPGRPPGLALTRQPAQTFRARLRGQPLWGSDSSVSELCLPGTVRTTSADSAKATAIPAMRSPCHGHLTQGPAAASQTIPDSGWASPCLPFPSRIFIFPFNDHFIYK